VFTNDDPDLSPARMGGVVWLENFEEYLASRFEAQYEVRTEY
jgi:hypothetical protein